MKFLNMSSNSFVVCVFEGAELALPLHEVNVPHVLVDRLPVAQLGVAQLTTHLLFVGFVPPGLMLEETLKNNNLKSLFKYKV